MPYLNWKESQIGQEITPHPAHEGVGGQSRLMLELKSTEIIQLADLLEEVIIPVNLRPVNLRSNESAQSAPELRVDLPRNWVIFWKRREGESRLLIAHPHEDEWVATAALDVEHGKKLVIDLRTLQAGHAIDVKAGGMSNVELHIQRAMS